MRAEAGHLMMESLSSAQNQAVRMVPSAPQRIQADRGIPRQMVLGAPSPVEHPGRNLQEAVCLRTVQSAAEKHANGLLDDR